MTDSSTHPVDLALLESELASLADEAVAILKIAPLIKQNGAKLFEQIEKCDAFAAASRDSLFIATSLPLANALIHYAASQYALAEARLWVREHWPEESDPTSRLAVLTLIYIIQQGVKTFSKDGQRKETWERIHRRIENILQAAPREAAVA